MTQKRKYTAAMTQWALFTDAKFEPIYLVRTLFDQPQTVNGGDTMILSYLTDVEILGRLIYGEARGEPHQGKQAIACVVRNRVSKPCWWGTSWRGVMLRPYQFSCFNPDSIDSIFLPEDDEVWYECLGVAISYKSIAALDDVTNGATHYCTLDASPPWMKGATLCTIIGNHQFYKDVP